MSDYSYYNGGGKGKGKGKTAPPTTDTDTGPTTDPYAFARGQEARANAKEHAQRKKAAEKYMKTAATLQPQVKALRRGVGGGFEKALKIRLANTNITYQTQDATLMDSYRARLDDLKEGAANNSKAADATTTQNVQNRSRERVSAVSEAMLHGAGETDTLRSQLMSLRNWDANQGEANRALHDGNSSLNSALSDLVQDTKTGRVNLATQRNADRDAHWTQFYNQQSETYTNLGNTKGQQAENYGLANEAIGSKKAKKAQKAASKASGNYFDRAVDFATSAWKNPGIPTSIKNWEGPGDFEARNNTSLIANAPTNKMLKKPEGAKLRAWTV